MTYTYNDFETEFDNGLLTKAIRLHAFKARSPLQHLNIVEAQPYDLQDADEYTERLEEALQKRASSIASISHELA